MAAAELYMDLIVPEDELRCCFELVDTGEVATIKRSMQKLSNRLNGMQAADPIAVMAELPVLQNATKQNGRMGG